MQLFEECLRYYLYCFVFQGEHGLPGSKGEEGEKVNYSDHVTYCSVLMFWYMTN